MGNLAKFRFFTPLMGPLLQLLLYSPDFIPEEIVMADQVETTIGKCKWHRDGRCVRRLKHRCRAAKGNCASPGLGPPPTVPDLLDFIDSGGSVEDLPQCDAFPGWPCPHLPVFDGHVLFSAARWCCLMRGSAGRRISWPSCSSRAGPSSSRTPRAMMPKTGSGISSLT